MCNRKETTLIDEYWMVVKEIFEVKDDMKLLHIVDKFSMSEHFWLTLGFTRIINVGSLQLTFSRTYSFSFKSLIRKSLKKCKLTS